MKKSFMELANDKPKLSKHDLDMIDRAHEQKHDYTILKRDGLQGLEKLENWGTP